MSLKRTPLFDWHVQHGGRMVEFGGWEMPVQYSSIVDEHQTVRTRAGLFDVSHMGRLRFEGANASAFLSHLLTCRVDNLVDGQVRYGLVCSDNGGTLDDILVNRVNANRFGMVVNASNRDKIVDWINQRVTDTTVSGDRFDGITITDTTLTTAMIAVQGPHALAIVNLITSSDFSDLRYYTGRSMDVAGYPVEISRTGYTGEDGFEWIVPAYMATFFWEIFTTAGVEFGLKPCGLGCRDTLRLEAAMPLYGHELSEEIDPITAGLGFAVKLDKPEFIGRDALAQRKADALRPIRVGLQLESRRIAREHAEVFAGDTRVGEVTSGTFSPTLEQSIAMAYVNPAHATVGRRMEVDIRGRREPAEIVSLPFYKRSP